MEYIYIGKIVNTHALKGEVRIISDFEFKDRIFKKDKFLFIGNLKEKQAIESYRKHKQYDMIKFIKIDSITEVLRYKGQNVYALKDDILLNEDEILISELYDYEIYSNDKCIGKINEYRCDNGNKMVKIKDKYIPYNKDFITKIDKKNKIIYYHDIEVFL